jgi:transposase
VEGTGTYGAGLARHLTAAGVQVLEVDRPNRQRRRRNGKSDPTDAEAAARAVLAGEATATPKTRGGIVESIRVLRVAHSGAIKARTQAANQLRDLLVTAPEELRAPLYPLSTAKRGEQAAMRQAGGFGSGFGSAGLLDAGRRGLAWRGLAGQLGCRRGDLNPHAL